ncbi:MAG TPA: extensin family protein [Methyloceanibacter sp.]|nr:extensin family protein [Methyloceanibacter sp.]
MGVRIAFLALSAAILAYLAGCAGGGSFNSGQRAPWRAQAEDACAASGVVRASAYVVPMRSIDGPGVCGLTRPLKVAALGGSTGLKPPATIGCPMTAALDRWVKNTVQPAAYRYYGQPVVEIRQISSFSCRGRNGNNRAHISEHSFGNAIDIAGFRLANGQEISVVRGWWRGGQRERGFLAEVYNGACAQFYTVLGPGGDRHHYNHFHLDLLTKNVNGGRHVCRPQRLGRRGIPVAQGGADATATGSIKPIPFVGPGED